MFTNKDNFKGLSRKQLKLRLILLFLLLLIPSALLIYKALTQIKWEHFHQNRLLAEEFSNRVEDKLSTLIKLEQARKFSDYSFLNVASNNSNLLLRSPLAEFPVQTQLPGLLGYFQIDNEGKFSSTLLPNRSDYSISEYGITTDEYIQRKNLEEKLFDILSQNKLLQASKIDAKLAQQQKELEHNQQIKEKRLKNDPLQDSDELVSGLAEFKRLPENLGETSEAEMESAGLSSIEKTPSSPSYVEANQQQSKSKRSRKKISPASQSAFENYSLKKQPSRSSNKQELGRVDQLILDEKLSKKSSEQVFTKKKLKSPKETTIAIDVIAEDDFFADEKKRPRAYPKKLQRLETQDKASVLDSKTESELSTLSESFAASKPAPLQTEALDYRINTFQSEMDSFEFGLLENGYFIIFRKVWRDEQRYIQGALIESKTFLNKLIETDFNNSSLAKMSQLTVAYDDTVLALYRVSSSTGYLKSSRDIKGNLLYRNRFSSPFSELSVIFSIEDIDISQGDSIVFWISFIIILVLCLGFYMMYQLGLRQIELLSQQQDFVSSVSHELKTPLTSIRMYGEMLREGWVNETKKRQYYDYIYEESERLSRLINNVLQLSKLSRDDLQLQLQSFTVAELVDHIKSKISSQVEASEFQLSLNCEPTLKAIKLKLDKDAFTQIMINLVDNAIKFSKAEPKKQINLECQLRSNNRLQFSVRDFGKGIENSQMKKIFKLFYRAENELTRETIGTGIGLALVSKLALAMDGDVDVVNKEPGAEFRVSFPVI